jgi:hypothetical protein
MGLVFTIRGGLAPIGVEEGTHELASDWSTLRWIGVPGPPSGHVDNGGGNVFIDDNDSIVEPDIDGLGTAGVTRGCNPPTRSKHRPGSVLTRGRIAAFLHRALG